MLFRSSDRDGPLLSSSSLLLLPLLLLLLLLLCTRAVIPRFVLTPSLHKLVVFFRSVLAAKAYRYEQENYSVPREEPPSASRTIDGSYLSRTIGEIKTEPVETEKQWEKEIGR